MPRVLVADSLSDVGVAILREAGLEVDVNTGRSEDETRWKKIRRDAGRGDRSAVGLALPGPFEAARSFAGGKRRDAGGGDGPNRGAQLASGGQRDRRVRSRSRTGAARPRAERARGNHRSDGSHPQRHVWSMPRDKSADSGATPAGLPWCRYSRDVEERLEAAGKARKMRILRRSLRGPAPRYLAGEIPREGEENEPKGIEEPSLVRRSRRSQRRTRRNSSGPK
jgi:hypothetical protein